MHAVTIGEVIGEDRVKVYHHGTLEADVSAETLVLGGGAPVYHREAKTPAYLAEAHSFNVETLPLPSDYNEILLSLLSSPSISCKRWVFDQYDSMVRTGTVPSSYDAAVVRIKGTQKALVLKTDCNARYVYLDPRRGGQIAVAEAARNVACTGAVPIAITNCLNFGNPYDPEIYWQFKEAVAGIGDACRILGTPVTGGNVSFYNESPDGAVLPTPVIGMLGLMDDSDLAVPSAFQHSGDIIILLGEERGEIGGSEYLFERTTRIAGEAPAMDLTAEKSLQDLCVVLSRRSLISSAHDCSEGGLSVAIAEALFGCGGQLGATIDLYANPCVRKDCSLFGETQSRVIISASPESLDSVLGLALTHAVPATVIGLVNTSGFIRIAGEISIRVSVAEETYRSAIPRAVGEA